MADQNPYDEELTECYFDAQAGPFGGAIDQIDPYDHAMYTMDPNIDPALLSPAFGHPQQQATVAWPDTEVSTNEVADSASTQAGTMDVVGPAQSPNWAAPDIQVAKSRLNPEAGPTELTAAPFANSEALGVEVANPNFEAENNEMAQQLSAALDQVVDASGNKTADANVEAPVNQAVHQQVSVSDAEVATQDSASAKGRERMASKQPDAVFTEEQQDVIDKAIAEHGFITHDGSKITQDYNPWGNAGVYCSAQTAILRFATKVHKDDVDYDAIKQELIRHLKCYTRSKGVDSISNLTFASLLTSKITKAHDNWKAKRTYTKKHVERATVIAGSLLRFSGVLPEDITAKLKEMVKYEVEYPADEGNAADTGAAVKNDVELLQEQIGGLEARVESLESDNKVLKEKMDTLQATLNSIIEQSGKD